MRQDMFSTEAPVEQSSMRDLADELQKQYGISDDEIDCDTFGLFDSVTGRSLTVDTR